MLSTLDFCPFPWPPSLRPTRRRQDTERELVVQPSALVGEAVQAASSDSPTKAPYLGWVDAPGGGEGVAPGAFLAQP